MLPHSWNYSYVYDPPYRILPAKSETLHKPYYLLWHIIISLVKLIYEKSKDVKCYNSSPLFFHRCICNIPSRAGRHNTRTALTRLMQFITMFHLWTAGSRLSPFAEPTCHGRVATMSSRIMLTRITMTDLEFLGMVTKPEVAPQLQRLAKIIPFSS